MKHWLIVIVLVLLALIGVLGLLQIPVSDCIQIYEQDAPVSAVALVMFALTVWLIPNNRTAHVKALAALLALLVVAALLYQPTGRNQYRQDVLGCTGKPDME